jgi:hypothetical protein
MILSYYGFVVCGSLLLPIGHWFLVKSQTSKLNSEILELQTPVRGYEISQIRPMGSEIFLKSTFSGKKNTSLPQNLTQFRSSMYDIPSLMSESCINGFRLKKFQYLHSAYIHPQTRQICSSKHRLVRDIQLLKLCPSVLVATVCVGISGYFMFTDYLLSS